MGEQPTYYAISATFLGYFIGCGACGLWSLWSLVCNPKDIKLRHERTLNNTVGIRTNTAATNRHHWQHHHHAGWSQRLFLAHPRTGSVPSAYHQSPNSHRTAPATAGGGLAYRSSLLRCIVTQHALPAAPASEIGSVGRGGVAEPATPRHSELACVGYWKRCAGYVWDCECWDVCGRCMWGSGAGVCKMAGR